MKVKGKFEIFEETESGRVKIGESDNHMMDNGMEFILDFAFGTETWFSGAAGYNGESVGSGHWHPYRYIAVGYSVDDNDDWLIATDWATTGADDGKGDNTTGGTGIKIDSVPVGEYISHFPNAQDNYMSSLDMGKANKNLGTGLFYKLSNKMIRTARTVIAEATFNTTPHQSDGDSNTIPTGTCLRELAIFIAEPTGIGNPSAVRENRTGVMIAKSNRYKISNGYIQDNPLVVGANSITIRYSCGDMR